jgi:hypothetical protein
LKCAVPSCGKAGELVPVLLLYSHPELGDHEPARAILGTLRVCSEDAVRATPRTFLTGDSWTYIRETFYAMGKAEPDPSRTLLDFVLPTSREMAAFRRNHE